MPLRFSLSVAIATRTVQNVYGSLSYDIESEGEIRPCNKIAITTSGTKLGLRKSLIAKAQLQHIVDLAIELKVDFPKLYYIELNWR